MLGFLNAANRFVLHGKAAPSRNARADILDSAAKSAQDLGLYPSWARKVFVPSRQPPELGKFLAYTTPPPQFDGFYLHAPDAATPIEETYEAIQELYESGVFARVSRLPFTE